MIKASVIVATWQNSDITIRCFKSLASNLGANKELVWIDNGSNESDYLKVCAAIVDLGMEKSTVSIRNKINLGFVKANNQGLKVSRGENLILLNNDTELYTGSLDRLIIHMKDLDIACPVSNNSAMTNPHRINAITHKNFPTPNGTQYKDYDDLLRREYRGTNIVMQWVPFFCVAIKRSVFDRIGLLDEESFSYGYGDDRDYCYRANKAGMKVGCVLDTFIFHQMAATFKILPQLTDEYWGEIHRRLYEKHPEYSREWRGGRPAGGV